MKNKAGNSKRRIAAVIQARMGSTRLPGKVLADILGKPMLWRVVERVRASRTVDQVVVATSIKAEDDQIAELCQLQEVACFRGSEEDVLDRYYQAAREYRGEIVVRITSDCPLIDRDVIDKTVLSFLKEEVDYASNSIVRTYPRGLDTEVFTFEALERAHAEARQPYQRSHVTPYLYENPALFRILSVTAEADHSACRWTVDTKEDLAFVRAVYGRLGAENCGFEEVLRFMREFPQLAELNRGIVQKALQEG
jgi:spore coat polysaccharide biosynthesis protein SpsF